MRNGTAAQVAAWFYVSVEDVPKDREIIFAEYTYEDYSGNALVVFQRDGQLFEVHGSHCSCNGLEGQWEPEPTTVEAILMRSYSVDGKALHRALKRRKLIPKQG